MAGNNFTLNYFYASICTLVGAFFISKLSILKIMLSPNLLNTFLKIYILRNFTNLGKRYLSSNSLNIKPLLNFITNYLILKEKYQCQR